MANNKDSIQTIGFERYLPRRFAGVFGHDSIQRIVFRHLRHIQGESGLALPEILCQLRGNYCQHVSRIAPPNRHPSTHDDFWPFLQVLRICRLRTTNLQER
jgi:hypothetical protein